MRKWSKQGFLNGADSNDSGWFKFSIRPRTDDYGDSHRGFSVVCKIADCSEQIHLDFAPESLYVDAYGRPDSLKRAARVKTSIANRRKKIALFAAAVQTFADKYNEALDEYEAEVDAAIQKRIDFNNSKE